MDAALRKLEVRDENMHHLHVDHEAELDGLKTFRSSVAFGKIVQMVIDLGDSCKSGTTVPEAVAKSSVRVLRIDRVLDEIETIVNRVEPLKSQSRFGNEAFRNVVDGVNSSRELEWLPDDAKLYLLASLGNAGRIDYGTGHELHFLCFLAVLREDSELLGNEDLCSVALGTFSHYFRLVRRLQTRYHLEPAGSRGCWGLDDYQFIPYLIGAAQLCSHPHLKPKSVCNDEIRRDFLHYMYFEAIEHVHLLKASSFAEHSPMLYDITAVKTWNKVYSGLLSMYNREVLGKYAVMQHFKYSPTLSKEPLAQNALSQIEALLPVSAADQRLGPILQSHKTHHVPCCGDAIQYPSSLTSK